MAAAALVATVAVVVGGDGGEQLAIVSLARGDLSDYPAEGVGDVAVAVAHTSSEWDQLWTVHHDASDDDSAEQPKVDVSSASIVAVFANGGYGDGVTIERVASSDGGRSVRVRVRHTPAADDCDVLGVSLTHFHIVRVSPPLPPAARVDLDVDRDVRDC